MPRKEVFPIWIERDGGDELTLFEEPEGGLAILFMSINENPVFSLTPDDAIDLGQEMIRWANRVAVDSLPPKKRGKH